MVQMTLRPLYMPAQIIQMMVCTQIMAIWTPATTLQDHLKTSGPKTPPSLLLWGSYTIDVVLICPNPCALWNSMISQKQWNNYISPNPASDTQQGLSSLAPPLSHQLCIHQYLSHDLYSQRIRSHDYQGYMIPYTQGQQSVYMWKSPTDVIIFISTK